MLNDPPPENRPVHPLERKPPSEEEAPPRRLHPLEQQPPAPVRPAGAPQQSGTLHIPSVTPYLTYALAIVNVAIFAAGYLFQPASRDLVLWGANHPARVLLDGEFYRLVTAMFLHGSIAHVMLNVLVLYSFGSSLERIGGHVRFALIYFLGGLGGSVLSAALGNGYSVGASGAIFALIGAEYVFLYQHRKLMGATGAARRRSLILLGLMNLAVGLLTTLGDTTVKIDNWGHLGGLVGGLALAQLINPLYIVRRHPDYPDSNHLLAVDINPLNRKYWVVSVYLAALIAVLIVASLIAR